MDADVFDLPDGTSLAVTDGDDGEAGRTIGLLVDDLDGAVAELRAAGVRTDDEVSGNERERYLHFWAPDGQLYELVERRR
jgi:glyoxylase I family protein